MGAPRNDSMPYQRPDLLHHRVAAVHELSRPYHA